MFVCCAPLNSAFAAEITCAVGYDCDDDLDIGINTTHICADSAQRQACNALVDREKNFAGGYIGKITKVQPVQTSNGYCNCQPTYTYRCAAGYYGSASANMTGCRKCPNFTNADGTTVAATSDDGDNRYQTKCYIAAGTELIGEHGRFVYTSNCSY